MLFLAALIHGVLIIGVTFNVFRMPESSESISLEVTIVADSDQHIERPDKAEYLAQTSQQGGGNTTDEVRPSAPTQSQASIDNSGTAEGNRLLDATPHEMSADQLLASNSEQARKVRDSLRQPPSQDSATALQLEAGVIQTLPLPQDNEANLQIHDDNLRQLIIAADTQESTISGYLDRWKRKIEAVGDAYMPDLGNVSGSPTLQVTIDADGRLVDIVILKTSGTPSLDQAALRILRRASPFDPFPESVRMEYDSLRFAYKWQFSNKSNSN